MSEFLFDKVADLKVFLRTSFLKSIWEWLLQSPGGVLKITALKFRQIRGNARILTNILDGALYYCIIAKLTTLDACGGSWFRLCKVLGKYQWWNPLCSSRRFTKTRFHHRYLYENFPYFQINCLAEHQ